MIYENSTYDPKKKEMSTFNTDTVKAALDDIHHDDHAEEEDEVEESDSDTSDEETSKKLHHSTSKSNQVKAGTKTAPLPKSMGIPPPSFITNPHIITIHHTSSFSHIVF